jgi:CRISPR/Cas system CMR subunit Cmr4 (Cas7 group RAMP superfamily)
MVKGKIKASEDSILSVPVAETLQVLAQFTSKILIKET